MDTKDFVYPETKDILVATDCTLSVTSMALCLLTGFLLLAYVVVNQFNLWHIAILIGAAECIYSGLNTYIESKGMVILTKETLIYRKKRWNLNKTDFRTTVIPVNDIKSAQLIKKHIMNGDKLSGNLIIQTADGKNRYFPVLREGEYIIEALKGEYSGTNLFWEN